jgi:peptidoglycan L-alanyl-D-glutamate endopeptidase CwlK
MPKFGTASTERLATTDPRLQKLFNEVIKTFDCTVIEGHRTKEKQNEYFAAGKSKLKWPEGKHCADPSLAADVAPYINGKTSYNTNHCLYFAGYVMGTAQQLGIKIRSGYDWDMDNEVITDQSFNDGVHFELIA